MSDRSTMAPITSTLITENPDFADIVIEFVNGLPGRLAKMQDCLNQKQFADLRRLAHQLKGAGGGYGYDILTDLGRELEDAALKEQLSVCTQSLQKIKETIERVVVGMQ